MLKIRKNKSAQFGRFTLSLLSFAIALMADRALAESKTTWALSYDSKTPIPMADWVDYLQSPFNPSQTDLFSGLDGNVNSFDYGLFNPDLGGGHIARAAQHALTYGNYMVGRQCLEEAVSDYMTANGIAVEPNKFLYDQGFWPMKNAGFLATDSRITKISKALKSLHGGDLVYSRISSNGPENGAEVVTLNCTVCHESRALVPTCSSPGCASSGKYKAVRSPWGAEGYISKNMKLMGKAVQDAIAKAAGGHSCASGPEKHIFAALYEIQKATHNSTDSNGNPVSVNLDPRRMLALTPDSSFYNPAGQTAHTVLNMLVNKGSWSNGKPSTVDQAYQLFRPEDILSNNQFFGILNANFNNLYGTRLNPTTKTLDAAPVNFSLNSAWAQKFNSPTENMFHGLGCFEIVNGISSYAPCNIAEKTALLAAATNSQGLNPDLSSETLSLFPGTTSGYKWPLRRFGGNDGVFERTSELFIGLASNGGNPAVADIINKRAMTYESIQNGITHYNNRCADCHGSASLPPSPTGTYLLNPGATDIFRFVDTLRDMPSRAYIANLRGQPYVQEDAARNLVIKEFDGYRGDLFYGTAGADRKLIVKNLVGIALEQRFGCYLNMTDFLKRATPSPIQVTTSVLDVTNLGYVKLYQKVHTSTYEDYAFRNYPGFKIYWQKEHAECGPLTSGGASQPTQFYDAPFHGDRLSGANANYPKLSATQIKEMIDFFVAISFDGTQVPMSGSSPVTLKLNIPSQPYIAGGAMNGAACASRCAHFGDSCDPTFESTASNNGRKCCADASEPDSFGNRLNLSCSTVGGISSWGYCTTDAQCPSSPVSGISYTCQAKKCVVSPKLTVTKVGTGTGTVTSSPAGISCGATCSTNVRAGTNVTLTAAPATGSTFTGWGGACSGTSTCSVTMSAARDVSATFTVQPQVCQPAGASCTSGSACCSNLCMPSPTGGTCM